MAFEKKKQFGNKKSYNKGKTTQKSNEDFTPSSPVARLTCYNEDQGNVNLTGMWLEKLDKGERAGSVFLRGKDPETGTIYQVWLNEIEAITKFMTE